MFINVCTSQLGNYVNVNESDPCSNVHYLGSSENKA